MVNEGNAAFGFAATAALQEAWSGNGWAKGIGYRDIRLLFSVYGSYLHGWFP